MNRTSRYSLLAVALCGVAAWQQGSADVKAGNSQVLGPFVGQTAVRDAANVSPKLIEFYGTDLGFSYEHRGRLHLIFGDSMGVEAGDPIEKSNGGKFDDSFGSIDLSKWGDPTKFAPGHIPPVFIGQNPNSTEAAAIDVGRPMEEFKTPIGGFSDGTNEFGVFFTYKPMGCSVDADCPEHTSCDTGLGEAGAHWKDPAGLTFPCNDNSSPACRNDTLQDEKGKPSGLCGDPT